MDLPRADARRLTIHPGPSRVASPRCAPRGPHFPIASPGRASLQAALHPAESRELYFVSRNDGSHQFSETLAEHARWVNLYQRHRGAVAQAAPSPSPS